jgi:hypothetical protein
VLYHRHHIVQEAHGVNAAFHTVPSVNRLSIACNRPHLDVFGNSSPSPTSSQDTRFLAIPTESLVEHNLVTTHAFCLPYRVAEQPLLTHLDLHRSTHTQATMVNKSLILAFTAMAAAAPQLGGLGGSLAGLKGLRPGSKVTSSDKAAASGESIPDGLNYNKPLEDDDDEDWSNWEYNEEDYTEDPEDPGTLGSTVENKPDPKPDNTTVVLQITSSASDPYEEFPSTTTHRNISTTSTIHRDVTTSTTLRLFSEASSTTLRELKSTSAPGYSAPKSSTTLRQVQSTAPAYKSVSSTTVRDEIPAYSTPVKQNDELETQKPYHTTSTTLKNEVVPEPYHTTSTTLKNKVIPEPYHTTSTTLKNEVVPKPYHTTASTTLKNEIVPEPYHTISTTLKNEVAPEPYHTTSTTLKNEIVPEPYHTIASTTLKNEIAPEPYHTTSTTQANVQQAYRREVEQDGYGKAEFDKQSHIPSTTRAAACAAKFSGAALAAVASGSIPSFDQTTEAQLSRVSGTSVAPAKHSSSSIWSAVPYSTPAVKPAVSTMATSSLPLDAATTPLHDKAVPSDAKILVNTLRPANATTQSAQDAKKNVASPAESTVKLERITTTSASVATASASMLLQPYYPTTTGAANATAGIAAATTGARSNNTLADFKGAAASSSSFIGASVLALAIAAFAL